MDIVRANIVDAKQFLLLIREQHYELEELKYERYLEENGLCLKVSNPARPCVSAGGPNDLSRIPVHIEQFVKKIAHEERHSIGYGKWEKTLYPCFRMPGRGPS